MFIHIRFTRGCHKCSAKTVLKIVNSVEALEGSSGETREDDDGAETGVRESSSLLSNFAVTLLTNRAKHPNGSRVNNQMSDLRVVPRYMPGMWCPD